MNKCIFTGRLTQDPELNITTNGNAILNFALAVDIGYGDNKVPSFLDMTAFKKTAETIANYCHKGSKILVNTTCVQDRYTNKAGKKVSSIKFIVNDFEFF